MGTGGCKVHYALGTEKGNKNTREICGSYRGEGEISSVLIRYAVQLGVC